MERDIKKSLLHVQKNILKACIALHSKCQNASSPVLNIHSMCVSRKFFQEGPRENSVCQGRRGVFRGLFLVSLQQMHDCVLSHKTHNRRLKLKKKNIKKASAWNNILDQFTIYDIKNVLHVTTKSLISTHKCTGMWYMNIMHHMH